MLVEELREELHKRDALIVHCTRAGRDSELKKLPIYPEDLRSAIKDLSDGTYREISCSLVWPAHMESFGAIGVVIDPTDVDGLGKLCPIDAGHGDAGSDGFDFSSDAVQRIFSDSRAGMYNEWVIKRGRVIALWINTTMPQEVARDVPTASVVSDPDALVYLPETVRVAMPITLDQLRMDFPDLPILAFAGGSIIEVRAAPSSTVT